MFLKNKINGLLSTALMKLVLCMVRCKRIEILHDDHQDILHVVVIETGMWPLKIRLTVK